MAEGRETNRDVNKDNYYLDIADVVLKRGSCRRRKFGSVVVKNDEIISTGYTGAPRKRSNCSDLGYCLRERLQVPRGQRYEICRSVHSEANAIISAARRDMIGATLYLVGREVATGDLVKDANSCPMCKRLIINAGIATVVVRDDESSYREIDVQGWVDDDDLPDMSSLGY